MSRMVNAPAQTRGRIVRFCFCLCIACLATHFLVEDPFFFAFFAPLDSTFERTNPMHAQESEHQDDLVFIGTLPVSVSQKDAALVAVAAPFDHQPAISPILTPPKI